jgi:hypothetical protein
MAAPPGSRGQAPPITALAWHGHPAEQLTVAAADAQLLVLGSRERGGFAGLLLGSVGHQCVDRARCPVVVVPEPGSGDRGGDMTRPLGPQVFSARAQGLR